MSSNARWGTNTFLVENANNIRKNIGGHHIYTTEQIVQRNAYIRNRLMDAELNKDLDEMVHWTNMQKEFIKKEWIILPNGEEKNENRTKTTDNE